MSLAFLICCLDHSVHFAFVDCSDSADTNFFLLNWFSKFTPFFLSCSLSSFIFWLLLTVTMLFISLSVLLLSEMSFICFLRCTVCCGCGLTSSIFNWYRNFKKIKKNWNSFPSELNEKEKKLSKLYAKNFDRRMEWEKTEKENFQKKKEKPIHLVQLMENQKEFEKIISECLTENSRLKKKRAYWSI